MKVGTRLQAEGNGDGVSGVWFKLEGLRTHKKLVWVGKEGL